MDAKLKEALIIRAKQYIAFGGIDALARYKAYTQACGCMGAQDGEPFCPCKMSMKLEEHLLEIMAELNPAMALTLMRKRIVSALK